MLIESRLWIAGVVQQCRDRSLADRLLRQVRACAQSVSQVLVCVDGWGAYPKAIVRAFREKVKMTSGKGRCSLQVWPQLLIGQVIKKQRKHRTVEVKRTLATRERSQLYEPACTTQEGARKSTPPSLNASRRRCANAWPLSPDPPMPACQSALGGRAVGHVSDWMHLQSVLDPSAVGSHSSHGSGSDRSCLEGQRGPLLQGGPRPFRATQTL